MDLKKFTKIIFCLNLFSILFFKTLILFTEGIKSTFFFKKKALQIKVPFDY